MKPYSKDYNLIFYPSGFESLKENVPSSYFGV